MHAVTRLGRVIQQLKSFGDLHATELEGMASTLEGAEAADVAAQVRTYRDIQRDEAEVVIAELLDIQNDMITAAQPIEAPEAPAAIVDSRDPAANSPKRAKWLAEQAAEAERLRQPVSRRELFGRVAPKADDES